TGFALYGDAAPEGALKATLHAPNVEYDWAAFETELSAAFPLPSPARRYNSHAVFTIGCDQQRFLAWLARRRPELDTFGIGERIGFMTDNDTEVAAGYLTWRLRQGMSLTRALEAALADLDGFYTFAIGTRDGFAILRDPIACKPAVLAETDDWVAMATEYRAIAVLPGAADAEMWEPEPSVVYAWEKALA